ncbi:MAG: NADH-quinone oxidoreductase subunit L [Nannocystaceae bacterium]|nr:NADH-quinone oxidoreductase subunit L [Nannocystaceae bacterium]
MPNADQIAYNLIYIPLFPLLGALFNLLFGKLLLRIAGDRLGRELVHMVAIAAVAFSCFFTISAVWTEMHIKGHDALTQSAYLWIYSGETQIGLDLLLDHLSAVMCMVITGVGLLIHIFSVGYMDKDPDYPRYFAYLNLFTASMLILVLGASLVVTFVGWEGVGVCSYLLIGFWYTDESKASAGKKAFIMNRIGDFGFIMGMLLIYVTVHSLDFQAIADMCSGGVDSPFVTHAVWGVPVATLATLFLFLGCTGKSAQIPLFTWLPDAMAGPTPVSALIHAATMVTAGVYLVVRLNFLFVLAPFTMAVIAVVGAVTALFAATIAVTQNDIKKVLAYSTVSQLGYMFLAVGMGAWGAAIFHLVMHAFFKACLFLGSGAVIEACHHNQDIREMGGLAEKMPVTSKTFLVSCLAISGVPLFSGFFSKDEILLHAYVNASQWSVGLNYVAYVFGLLAAFCTAFYMFRLYYLTFKGEFRGDHHTWKHHVGEVWIMSMPLVVLAALAAFGGLLGVPHVLGEMVGGIPHVFDAWLAPVTDIAHRFNHSGLATAVSDPDSNYFLGVREGFAHDGHVEGTVELVMMAVSVTVAVAGIALARQLYINGPSDAAARYAKRFGLLYTISHGKYWVDTIYDNLIVRPVRMIGGICYQVFDQLIIDTLGVKGVSGTVGFLGNQIRRWHNGNVRRYLVVLLLGVVGVLAAVYANPTISQIGPSKVNPQFDLGGLRPTLGPRRKPPRPAAPAAPQPPAAPAAEGAAQ